VPPVSAAAGRAAPSLQTSCFASIAGRNSGLQTRRCWRFTEFEFSRSGLWAGNRNHLSPLGHGAHGREGSDTRPFPHQLTTAPFGRGAMASSPPERELLGQQAMVMGGRSFGGGRMPPSGFGRANPPGQASSRSTQALTSCLNARMVARRTADRSVARRRSSGAGVGSGNHRASHCRPALVDSVGEEQRQTATGAPPVNGHCILQTSTAERRGIEVVGCPGTPAARRVETIPGATSWLGTPDGRLCGVGHTVAQKTVGTVIADAPALPHRRSAWHHDRLAGPWRPGPKPTTSTYARGGARRCTPEGGHRPGQRARSPSFGGPVHRSWA